MKIRAIPNKFTLAAALFLAAIAGPLLRSQDPAQTEGANGTLLKLRRLGTIASAMHTTAHPDDEHGGLLSMLSHGQGARVSLLTLNRGESGDNAIGPELFDGLGLIRTEELLVSNRYYGVDRQYFTTVVDYGFSKRLDEALDKWGRENVLRDVVRIIRADRPLVLISRFQGNQRDGHGNHQTAGLITQDAYRAAGDPKAFPEQIAEGLRPWQPLKLYIGGARAEEDWTIRVDTGTYDPLLGNSYQSFARLGLSFQRSQNSGRLNQQPGPSIGYYRRLAAEVEVPAKEQSFFDGIDTSVRGTYKALRKQAPAGADALLAAIETEAQNALRSFKPQEPAAAVPALVRGLRATREASRQLAGDADVEFILMVKEAQFTDAIRTAMGADFTAMARPAGMEEPTGPFAAFSAPPAMGPVTPGQTFEVIAGLTNRSPVKAALKELRLEADQGWSVKSDANLKADPGENEPVNRKFTVTVPQDARLTRPYWTRGSIGEARYSIKETKWRHRPAAPPALTAVARYEIDGTPVEIREVVKRRESNLPYGYTIHELAVVPAIAVNVKPSRAIVPLAGASRAVNIQVELLNNWNGEIQGDLKLRIPSGWSSQPASHPFRFTLPGERASYSFSVAVPSLGSEEYRIEAVASARGAEFREGYDVIEHRDLETRYLYHDAVSRVRGIDVKIAPGLKVGYIMGVGDDVPSGIAQLGAAVHLLDEKDLAGADLKAYDAIITGTRAYAVREDLKTYNQRLLDYVKEGGNLIVLYNTQEFIPNKYAPYPADLPQRAEEVSEEDSPLEILAPDHRVFQSPNRITKADFDGWVEQRGSKFFSRWDPAYTPMISTYDKGQQPQKGGWLYAGYGKGHYTYFAYAFHRQLPYGVAGAYRLLANLLSLGK